MTLIAFTSACGWPRLVHDPVYAVVAPEGPCARACVEQPAEHERQIAECLTACEGAQTAAKSSCAETGRAGYACATAWRERVGQDATTKTVLGTVAGLALGVLVIGLFVSAKPFGAHQ